MNSVESSSYDENCCNDEISCDNVNSSSDMKDNEDEAEMRNRNRKVEIEVVGMPKMVSVSGYKGCCILSQTCDL